MAYKTAYQGFTLIEVLIAAILVGLSIAALVGANSSFTIANGAGTDLSTAEFLVEQIREMTTMLPVIDPQTEMAFDAKEASWTSYDDVDDFDGFNSPSAGPISANKTVLTEFATFGQQVTVDKVSPSNLDLVVADADTSAFVRVTVRVLQNGRQVVSASWVRAKY
jgi:prepilin-type N-terminal cleavage/methylation domain-containing protein